MGLPALERIISMQRERRRRQTRARGKLPPPPPPLSQLPRPPQRIFCGSIASAPKRKSSALHLQQDGNSQGAKRMKYLPILPEDIWWHIHSLMPMLDAARAACVSRTFMHSWRRHTSLTFSEKTLGMDENVCEKDGKARDLTYKVANISIEHPGIGVKRVRIEFDDYKTRAYYLDRWLQIAITTGIEELSVSSSMCQKKVQVPMVTFI